MKKSIRFLSICILSVMVGFLTFSNHFLVFADNDGSFFYVPNESLSAYNFFLSYGLTYSTSEVLSDSSIAVPTYSISNESTTITPNYSKIFTAHNAYTIEPFSIPSGSYRVPTHSEYTYFLNSGDVSVNPQYTVRAYSSSVNAYTEYESNSLVDKINFHALTGTFVNPTSYNANQRIYLARDRSYVISFFVNKSLPSNGGITVYSSTGNTSDIVISRQLISYSYGNDNLIKYTYLIKNNGPENNLTLAFNFNSLSNVKLIPLYVGRDIELTDEYAQFLGLDTDIEKALKSIDNKLSTTNELLGVLVNGNAESDAKVDDNTSSNDNLDNVSSQLHSIDSSNLSNMSSQLDSIGTSNQLYSTNGFLDAAWFLTLGYSRFISLDSSGALRLMLTFALLLGIALTIIGKLRN